MEQGKGLGDNVLTEFSTSGFIVWHLANEALFHADPLSSAAQSLDFRRTVRSLVRGEHAALESQSWVGVQALVIADGSCEKLPLFLRTSVYPSVEWSNNVIYSQRAI